MHLTDPRLLRSNCYLDGRWEAADDGRTLLVSNPADGEILGEVPMMAAVETRRAIAAAAAALPQTGRERDDRHAANAAGSDLRVRFDRRARLLDAAEWQDVRQSTWQQNWVSGRDAHVARKNADWRVVVSRV